MKSQTRNALLSIIFLFFILDAATLAESFSDHQPAKLFVNVIVRDPSDAICAKLSERIGKLKLPRFMKVRMTKRVGAAAGRVVKPTMVAAKMSSKMSQEMPKKMATKGLTVEVQEHYREGPYFVMQLQVRHVNSVAMAEAKIENKSVGARLQKFLTFIGAKNQDKLETFLLPGLIEKKLPSMMTEMMSGKLSEKGVKAEAKVLPESKQVKYFDSKIKQIREAAVKLEQVA